MESDSKPWHLVFLCGVCHKVSLWAGRLPTPTSIPTLGGRITAEYCSSLLMRLLTVSSTSGTNSTNRLVVGEGREERGYGENPERGWLWRGRGLPTNRVAQRRLDTLP